MPGKRQKASRADFRRGLSAVSQFEIPRVESWKRTRMSANRPKTIPRSGAPHLVGTSRTGGAHPVEGKVRAHARRLEMRRKRVFPVAEIE